MFNYIYICNIRLATRDLLQSRRPSLRSLILFYTSSLVSNSAAVSWPLVSILMHHLLNEVLEFNCYSYCHRVD